MCFGHHHPQRDLLRDVFRRLIHIARRHVQISRRFSAPRFLIICLLCLVFSRFPWHPPIKHARPEHFYPGGSTELGEVPDVEMEMSETPVRNESRKRFGGDIFEDFRRIRGARTEVSKFHRLYIAL